MTDLTTLLDHAAGPAGGPVHTEADLTRGRRALARTRVRRTAAGLAGVAAAGVIAVGLTAGGHDAPVATERPAVVTLHRTAAVAAGGFSFTALPVGWSIAGVTPTAVTLTQDGADADPDPDVFTGKVTVTFDGEFAAGERIRQDGQDYWLSHDSAHTWVSAYTRPGEPTGRLAIQFPDDTGWTRQTMLDLVSAVRVLDAAQPGVG
jgi:hypothetical protein